MADQDLRLPLPTDTPLDPPAAWAELRARCPVAHATLPSGDTAVYLTRYDDVRTLLSDPRFVRPTERDGAARVAPEGSGGAAATGSAAVAIPGRGEPHQRWRRRVGKYFTAKRMTALRPGMTRLAEDLVDAMLAQGAPADLRASLGFPLPVHVICDLLGVPAEDRDRFSHWSDSFLSVTRYTAEEIATAQREFTAYMARHVAAKRARPTDDLLGTLITDGEEEGGGPTDDELVATGMGLLVAGHETTANMIGKMAGLLLGDRSRWERLLADPSLVRTAVEESLRFDANLGFGLRRYLGEDAEIAGQVVPAGSTVVCSMPAANRDERAFTGADAMDLARTPNPHLAFGVGPHSCLGQALARTELQVVLETLLRRVPTLRLAVPVAGLRKTEGLLVGGLREVPVRW
ncbi:cytochrome P450 [Streptomyces griseoviridis]|uniref:Cytochrome P450 n=2 Tax=Streptomyces TaxID=1883 RepID=A0A918GSE6_STRGD|nr:MULTISPECIES: cytochrome P450 [Streptomyces]GGS54340.1 cytochrome P450 [Streptomyces niveoruber]GGU50835.1 cytochrome P450 [Streptomyces daghestanicus]GHI31708.1 cytochrome P450 [Streptomyces daghestanicus]